ncbi:MAG: NAD-dependent protein deacylase [Clostridia bacterium]|nr:NAD-dependent protein deacylase [Clostridia bacterium]MBP3588218.1 NAD-dependent protein deacylase [Clostridia bacterium]
MTELETLQQYIDEAGSIVFFGGAGVSTESGVPDFRSVDGLYNQKWKYPPETILSHSFFMAHTGEFYEFYKEKMLFSGVEPNAAHKKLAELEAAGKLTAVITQNIDGLHQAAGSKTVLELHGSVHRNYCRRCRKFYDAKYMKAAIDIPLCDCGGIIKPDVVLYEESLDGDTIEAAVTALHNADLLIIGGTSLAVYPAAGLIQYFGGSRIVLLNRDVTPYDGRATLCIREPIGKVLGQIEVR